MVTVLPYPVLRFYTLSTDGTVVFLNEYINEQASTYKAQNMSVGTG